MIPDEQFNGGFAENEDSKLLAMVKELQDAVEAYPVVDHAEVKSLLYHGRPMIVAVVVVDAEGGAPQYGLRTHLHPSAIWSAGVKVNAAHLVSRTISAARWETEVGQQQNS